MNVFAPVAVWGFWALLGLGWYLDELQPKGIVIFIALWAGGVFLSPFVLGGTLFLPYIALLDIALVLAVFKGDVTLR
jgi:hypothetical protein